MDSAVSIVTSDLRLDGRLVHAETFAEEHAREPRYIGWLRDHDVVRTLNLPEYMIAPVSEAELLSYCRSLRGSERDIYLALYANTDKRFVGTLKAGRMDFNAGTVDVGIMIGDKSYWGQGLATDAVFMFCRYLFEELDFRRATAGAMEINPAMISVFEKLGFRREGRLRSQDRLEDGSFCDHILLGCFANELIDLYKT